MDNKELLEQITAGQWIVRNKTHVRYGDAFEIRPVGFDKEENEANALLISKAPELLKRVVELEEENGLLKRFAQVVSEFNTDHDFNEIKALARKLLTNK